MPSDCYLIAYGKLHREKEKRHILLQILIPLSPEFKTGM